MTINSDGADLVDEIDGEQGVEDVVRELRRILDQVGRSAERERHEEGRRPQAHPRVHGEERQTGHGREAMYGWVQRTKI